MIVSFFWSYCTTKRGRFRDDDAGKGFAIGEAGILPPSSGRRRSEGAEVGSQRNETKWEEVFSRFVIPSAAEGSFSLAVRRRVFDSRERETPYRGRTEAVLPLKGLAKGRGKRGRKRFLAFARNDDAKNGILPPSPARGRSEGDVRGMAALFRRHSPSFLRKEVPRRGGGWLTAE